MDTRAVKRNRGISSKDCATWREIADVYWGSRTDKDYRTAGCAVQCLFQHEKDGQEYMANGDYKD